MMLYEIRTSAEAYKMTLYEIRTEEFKMVLYEIRTAAEAYFDYQM